MNAEDVSEEMVIKALEAEHDYAVATIPDYPYSSWDDPMLLPKSDPETRAYVKGSMAHVIAAVITEHEKPGFVKFPEQCQYKTSDGGNWYYCNGFHSTKEHYENADTWAVTLSVGSRTDGTTE